MSYILEKLYLGGIEDACNTKQLQDQGITHMLTVESRPLALMKHKDFEYKYVHALDMEDTDILSHLQECIDFIHAGRESGGILVHCYVGQSRSASMVLAYMMQQLAMTLYEAMAMLKKLKPDVSPNSGFEEQLELFESMGNKLDTDSSVYKMYKLSILAKKVQMAQSSEGMLTGSLAADPTAGAGPGAVYKCRKCRRPLFRQSAVLPHTTGIGEAAFTWRVKLQGGGAAEDGTACQQQIFVEPVAWMEEDILQIEGKLSCPKCSSKLGSFRWSGERCPCGTWVTPAFHVQKNKVDLMQPPALPQQRVQSTGAGLEEARRRLGGEGDGVGKTDGVAVNGEIGERS